LHSLASLYLALCHLILCSIPLTSCLSLPHSLQLSSHNAQHYTVRLNLPLCLP
jgi:hypothetical protein